MSITQEEVATKAGVSTQTVHRVINNPALVSDATRQKVEATMAELGFTGERVRRGKKPSAEPLVHQLSLRVDGPTAEELIARGEFLDRTLGKRSRGWDAEIVRRALDWAFYPPEGVEPMPDGYAGRVNRVNP